MTSTRDSCAPAVSVWENEGGRTPAPLSAPLAWAAFIARFYPDARRHDYAPIAAYELYRSRARVTGA